MVSVGGGRADNAGFLTTQRPALSDNRRDVLEAHCFTPQYGFWITIRNTAFLVLFIRYGNGRTVFCSFFCDIIVILPESYLIMIGAPSMPQGTLEVVLVSAKGLENTDFLCNMDPYAILTCRTQEKKSSVASGKGSNPEWNETFLFNVSDGISELKIKIMDSDNIGSDDVVGEAVIPLESVLSEGSIPQQSYNVVKEENFCGEIRVALTFRPEFLFFFSSVLYLWFSLDSGVCPVLRGMPLFQCYAFAVLCLVPLYACRCSSRS
nr:elicitor-responsive protein 3 [Ipomoea batatas]